MGGLLDGLFGTGDDYPDFKAPEWDPNSKAFIDKNIASGPQKTESAYDRAIKAAQGAQGLMPSASTVNRQESAMGRTNQSQTDAIIQKGQNSFSNNIQKMALQNQINEDKAKSGAIDTSFKMTSYQKQLLENVRQARMLSEQNKIAARNQVIREIFSAGGMAAGMAIAGPAGAGIGAKMGGAFGPGGEVQTMDSLGIGDQEDPYNFEGRKWQHKDYNRGEYA